MAVSTLRTIGFWMYAALFFTVQIRKTFQEIETNAQMLPKMKIPNPKEKSFGTKAGKNATA